MQMIINGVMDLMKLDYILDIEKYEKLREILFYGQRMGRIGNSVTTYDHEIMVGDFSSEVVCLAITLKLISYEELITNPKKSIQIIKKTNLENILLEYWMCYKNKILILADDFPELDIKKYTKGLTFLRQLHLQSRGKK